MGFLNRFTDRRERKLVRCWESGFYKANCDQSQFALLDFNLDRDMILYAYRTGDFYVWRLNDDPDAFEDEVHEFRTYDEAHSFFANQEVTSSLPDWELQAEYDELHGTINGEDPGVVAMRELWQE